MEYGSNQEDIMEIFKKSEKLKQEQELAKTQEETVAPKYGSKKQQTIETIEINSDEEIEEMAKYKTPWEIEQGVKFSKRGLIDYIEKNIAFESA